MSDETHGWTRRLGAVFEVEAVLRALGYRDIQYTLYPDRLVVSSGKLSLLWVDAAYEPVALNPRDVRLWNVCHAISSLSKGAYPLFQAHRLHLVARLLEQMCAREKLDYSARCMMLYPFRTRNNGFKLGLRFFVESMAVYVCLGTGDVTYTSPNSRREVVFTYFNYRVIFNRISADRPTCGKRAREPTVEELADQMIQNAIRKLSHVD